MLNKIFIKKEDFIKMTKTEKLKMPVFNDEIEVSRLLLLPLKKKMYGYGMSAFFVETKRGWVRLNDYDCWQFTTDIENPVDVKYGFMKGDFEYGGILFFEFAGNTDVKIKYTGYGGNFEINKI